MLYALIIASNLAWVVVLGLVLRAHQRVLALADARESARDQNHREHLRHLEDQIVLLKVDPQQAATQAFPPVEDQQPMPVDDSPYADQAWADFMDSQ